MGKKDHRLGWHILRNAGLRYGDGRCPAIGVPLEMKRSGEMSDPVLCVVGMHASPTIEEALHHRDLDQVSQLTLVLVGGDITAKYRRGDHPERGMRKFVGRRRTVLGRWSHGRVQEVFREECRRLKFRLDGPVFPVTGLVRRRRAKTVPRPVWAAVERRLLRSAGLESWRED